MNEKPTRWDYITTSFVLLLMTAWAVYDYRTVPDKIPFEPIIAVVSYLILLWGYCRWKKGKDEQQSQIIKQQAEKIFNIEEIKEANFGTNVKDSCNVVVDSTITAGRDVHIGDKIYGNKKIPHALTKPPFQSEIFLGRVEDLKNIKEQLFSGDNLLLLVNGQGGMGKTTIATKYYTTHANLYEHTAWVLSEKNIANALVTHLAAPLGIAFEPTDTLAQKLEALLAAMANLGKPCLLVIDNANELKDLEDNYLLLRSCPNFHLLLTSRITEFQQATFYPIIGLPKEEALELFKILYKKTLNEQEKAIFSSIYEAVGNNTLVVEILAKNLYLLNRLREQYSLASLLHELQTKGLLALSKTQVVTIDYHAKDVLRKEKPEDIIAAMYDLSNLTTVETALLSVFAVLPAENIEFDVLESLLAGTENLQENALSLAQKGWLEFDNNTKSFKCNPVVQEITRKKNPTLRQDCEALILALIEKLEPDNLHEENYKYSTVFVHYAETIVAAFLIPDFLLLLLFQGIGNFNLDTGNLDKAQIAYLELSTIAEQLLATEPSNVDFKNGLAVSYLKLGETHTILGNLDKASAFYKDYYKLIQGLYNDYPNNVSLKNGLAISYLKLGETYTLQGDVKTALTFYEDFHKLAKELYEAHPKDISFKNGLAISHEKLGETHTELGNLDKALAFYEDDLKLTKELYETYPNNVFFKKGLAISYEKLGNTHTTLGNIDKASAFYNDEVILFKKLYENYLKNVSFKKGLAISYHFLGNTHKALGNLEKALGFYEDYYKLSKKLYNAYPNNVNFKNSLAIAYYCIGLFSRDELKDKTKSRAYFIQAEALWLGLVRDALQYMQFQQYLGQVQQDLKNL